MNTDEQINDEVLDEKDINEEEFPEDEQQSVVPRWKDLSFIPHKKRFIILTTVFSVVELTGMIILAYAFIGSFPPEGLWDLGLFLMPPFTGVAIAYFVSDQKEAVAVSFINAITSIVIFWVIFLSIEAAFSVPGPINTLETLDYIIPIAMILIQVVIAFTIARLRNIYRYYGDSAYARESDEDMIKELKQSRIERGLETPDEDEEEDTKEK